MKHAIRNTTADVNANPLAALVEYGFGGGGIERSERRGQGELLRSETLPTDARGDDAPLLALGFTFGEPVSGDPLFRAATLPAGWTREGSDHAMWSYLVDERGIKRVRVFYKAAFYDRAAHMGLINVGANVASAALYSDVPVTAETLRLDVLTPDELAELRASMERMRADIERSPRIYGDRAPRLAECDAILSPSPTQP